MNDPDWKVEDMKFLDEGHEGVDIQDMARGMDQAEVCDYFGVTMDEMQKSKEDWKFFQFHYRMGRSQGRKQAVDSLFKQMDQRQGGQVALSYLARFGEEWKGELDADSEQKGRKSFRVVLD